MSGTALEAVGTWKSLPGHGCQGPVAEDEAFRVDCS